MYPYGERGSTTGLYNPKLDQLKDGIIINESVLGDNKYRKINIVKAITIDFFTLNQYINNNEISELIKNYIILCSEVKDNDESKFNTTRKMKNNLKDEILQLLINISYIEFDSYIKNKYKTSNYIIYNFNSEQIYLTTNYMSCIQFRKYLIELKKKSIISDNSFGGRLQIGDISGGCITGLFDIIYCDKCNDDSLATIIFKGDLWYTV